MNFSTTLHLKRSVETNKLEKVLGTHNNQNNYANGKKPNARIDSSDDCIRADTVKITNYFEDKVSLSLGPKFLFLLENL